jgi:hypothetical protein
MVCSAAPFAVEHDGFQFHRPLCDADMDKCHHLGRQHAAFGPAFAGKYGAAVLSPACLEGHALGDHVDHMFQLDDDMQMLGQFLCLDDAIELRC